MIAFPLNAIVIMENYHLNSLRVKLLHANHRAKQEIYHQPIRYSKIKQS